MPAISLAATLFFVIYRKEGRLVRVDPGQIEQVFINLVFNAVEAMKGKGRLTISTESVDGGEGTQIIELQDGT